MVDMESDNHFIESQDQLLPMTILSKLLKIIVKMKIIPIKVDYKRGEATFSFCSREFLIYGLIVTTIGLLNMFIFYFFLDGMEFVEIIDKQLERFKGNITDTICLVSYWAMLQMYTLYPVILFKSSEMFPSELILARDLKWPKYGYLFVLSYLAFFIGMFLQTFSLNV